METAQRFSLGAIVSPTQITAPREVAVKVRGRGIFCRLDLEFSFALDDPNAARVFALDRPWNAVLIEAAVNGEPLEASESLESRSPLPLGMKAGVEEILQEGAAEGVCCCIEAGKSLRTITLSFVMVCDVLWHQTLLDFHCHGDSVATQIDFHWDLAGLPGAVLSCEGEGADSRFSHLDTARYMWSENLTLGRGERFGVRLALDEKKAASLCLFSSKDGKSGCGAVVVVAPVRPQLQRRPVKIALLLEIRNPQEGLLARELVDRLRSVLNPDDQLSLYVLGSTSYRCVKNWHSSTQITEDVLSQLLDPALMGRPQNFWESYREFLEECRDATHMILSTPGPKEVPPPEVATNIPVFCFVTARKAKSSTLGELTAGTGSFVGENSIDGVDSFLQRMNVRLSPPLLREFRLEGWGLENSVPSKPTQVFMDKPTLVLGQYEGLLPQTITLAGVAPAGQKLGQRVKVESYSEFSFEPLHRHAGSRGYDLDQCLQRSWRGGQSCLLEINRPAVISELFSLEEPPEIESDGAFGAPPAMEAVSSAVTLDDELMGTPSEFGDPSDDIFSGAAGDSISDEIFAAPSSGDIDQYFLDSPTNELGAPEADSSEFSDSLDSGPVLRYEGAPTRLPQITLDFGDPDDEPLFDSNEVSEESLEPSLSLQIPDHPSVEPSVEEPSVEDVEEQSVGSLELPAAPETREDSLEPAPVLEPRRPSLERTLRTSSDKATLSVRLGMPSWVKQLVSLEGDAVERWLNACPIDTLSLGLAHTEETLVRTLVEKLPSPKRTAVELQVELGKLLPAEEIESACSELERLF